MHSMVFWYVVSFFRWFVPKGRNSIEFVNFCFGLVESRKQMNFMNYLPTGDLNQPVMFTCCDWWDDCDWCDWDCWWCEWCWGCVCWWVWCGGCWLWWWGWCGCCCKIKIIYSVKFLVFFCVRQICIHQNRYRGLKNVSH